jgi:hypothetical protein
MKKIHFFPEQQRKNQPSQLDTNPSSQPVAAASEAASIVKERSLSQPVVSSETAVVRSPLNLCNLPTIPVVEVQATENVPLPPPGNVTFFFLFHKLVHI